MTEAETIAWIVREFDAIELTDDCANPIEHARQHQPHPDRGRTVCVRCHPPAGLLAHNGGRP